MPVPQHAPQGQLSRLPYLPGLDGMRALAVGAVMVYHANHHWLPGGFLGVEVFFVISGYLITLLLVGEDERNGFIDLKAFWTRRFRRLLPALITMLVLLSIVMAVTWDRARGRTRGDFIAAFPFYSSNWYQIWVGQGYSASEAFVPLRHLWSLAVEEQFYLLWPLIMIFLLRRRDREGQARLGVWLIGISVFLAAVMGVLYVGGDVVSTPALGDTHGYWNVFGRFISVNDFLYLGSVTRAGGILLGAGVALLWRPAAVVRGPLRDKARQLDLVGVGGLVVLAGLCWWLYLQEPGAETGTHFNAWLFRGGFLLTGLATVAIIVAVTHRATTLSRLLGTPLLNWVGTRSYGLYLYHWPIYQLIRRQAGVALSGAEFVGALIATVVLTEASYRLIETPVRKGKLGAWWSRTRDDGRKLVGVAGVATLAVFGGASLSLADNVCVGDTECALEVANAPDDSVGETPAAPVDTLASTVTGGTDPVGATGPVGSAATPPTTGSSSSEPAADGARPYAAFGESVMAGAVKPLRSGGGYVHAVEGSGAKNLLSALDAARRDGLLDENTPVAIQIGTNGSVSAESLDAIMAELPTQPVVFLTVKAPGLKWIAPNNERIRALADKYANVKILDWASEADSLKLCKDGIHISCDAKTLRAYANLIFEAIDRSDLVK